ncbi:hypothetical protein Sjap_026154 [Stephania japonica]|uniref:RING-type domain-containing protein n=1 Tax=Stephania japonica TaxID=461633 RepID=A0AAP0E656_9MAGN
MQDTTNLILTNCRDHPSLKQRAANLKEELLYVRAFVLFKIIEDPSFYCMIKCMKDVLYSSDRREDVCAICLDEFGDQRVGLDIHQTKCNHIFHGRCIFMWLKAGRHTCPLCRCCLM